MIRRLRPPFVGLVCLIWALAGALLLGGCGARSAFDSPYDEDAPMVLREGTLEEIAALLDERTRDHQTVVRQGRIVIEAEAQDAKAWFEGNILIRNDPRAVRLRGSRVPIGTLFEVTVSGDSAWVYLNREKELFTGTADELRRSTGLAGNISLRELVSSILVTQDLRDRLNRPGKWTVYPTKREIILVTPIEPDRNARALAWRIRRRDGLVREFVRFGPTAEAELRVTYESWVLEDGEPLPGQFVAEVLGGAVQLTLRLNEYKLDRPLADAVFDQLPRQIDAFYPLEALGSRESVVPPGEEEPGG